MDSPYSPHVPDLTWRGLFQHLARARMRTVISLRNRDTHLAPAWMAAVPQTDADWNEWWEYVFAMGYWLNVRRMHRHLADSGHPDYPIWLSEWGTYDVSYDVLYMGLALVENLIRFSQPGDDYVYGSHVFSFYDWVYEGNADWGVISGDGTRHASYYALRLAIRALKDGKPTFAAATSAPDLSAIATKNQDGTVNLLVLNWSETVSYTLRADLSGLLTTGAATIREFSANHRDDIVGETELAEGVVCFTAPAYSAVLLICREGT